MRGLLIIIISCVFMHASFASELSVVVNGHEQKVSLADLKRVLPVRQVTIHDPVYHQTKKFQAFELKALLSHFHVALDVNKHELVMTALDGYAPPIAISAVQQYPAYLAFAEQGMADFQFSKVQFGKSKVSPAPFYLVWQVEGQLADTLPWPFQVVKIARVDLAEQYAAMYPAPTKDSAHTAAIFRGFQLFRQQCVRCHSINLQGGVVGPELNAPKNITEYWDDSHLRALIKDASSYRYRSKMPAFPDLSAQDIDDLLHYLRQMSTQKIAAPQAP